MVLDLVVIGILLLSAGVAFLRGFVREVFTIASLLGALAATYFFGPNLKPTVSSWLIDPEAKEPQRLFDLIPYEMIVPVIAFALVFIVVLAVLTIATHLISKGVHSVGLGPVDRSLGVVFGLVRGVLVIGLMGLVLDFVLSEQQREDYFGDSKTYTTVAYTSELMQALLPGRDVLERGAKKKGNDLLAATGKEPLEPGQTGRARSSNNSDFSAIKRKAVDAAVDAQANRIKKQYND